MLNFRIVPTISSSMPISPASTPRRAVLGALSHFREKTNSAVAIRYVHPTSQLSAVAPEAPASGMAGWAAASVCGKAISMSMASSLLLLALEHLEHAIGNQKAADDVACGGNAGNGSQDGAERRALLGRDPDRRHHRNRRNCVGQRRQRRVQQRRDAPDDLEAQERREHEHEQCRPDVIHRCMPLRSCQTYALTFANRSRTRGLTISPFSQISVSRMISSSLLTLS